MEKIDDMNTQLLNKDKTFYEVLQITPRLDLRDNRGKRHDLALVLLGVVIALLRDKDGTLSRIHRSIKNTNDMLCNFLGIETEVVVSRSHFPILLEKVNGLVFEELLMSYYGIQLTENQRKWFGVDGKELRGSIEKGAKRGNCIVQVVDHETMKTHKSTYYEGTKESEKQSVKELLSQDGLGCQKISLDALHFSPDTINIITKQKGTYIIGLKNNQGILSQMMDVHISAFNPIYQVVTEERGHGRIEKRTYEFYDISMEEYDKRWEKAEFRTLIIVNREIINLKTGKKSQEYGMYISNANIEDYQELAQAVREHWSVETNNHLRDITLKEDRLKTKKKGVSRTMASIRTLVINVLLKKRGENLTALIDFFNDRFDKLLLWLREINFL